jgi:pyruvate,water dikinase
MAARFPLLELTALDEPAEAGGKGAVLAELVLAGFPVPPAWVLPAGALRDHLARFNLAALAEQVEAELAAGAWQPAALQVWSAILHGPLPSGISSAVAHLLDRLATSGRRVRLAVRSSATCEGLPGASFAGQFQTFLDIQDFDQASAAILSCWASLWSPSALAYRAAHPPAPMPRMAVLLQEFLPGVASGAARVHEAGVEIESAWGLGPSVLSGLVVPDRYRFGLDGHLLHSEPGRKPVRAAARGGNLIWEPIEAPQRDAPSLDQATAGEVGRLALQAAALLGTPADLEWTFDGATVWLLQGRRTERVPRRNGGTTDQSTSDEFRGIPAAPGEVVGRVHVADGPQDLEHANPGEVLVTRYASAALVARFRGAGLATEMGGASAHAAAIARERRLPMVTGALGITQRLRQGQLVWLDATRGVLQVLEQ